MISATAWWSMGEKCARRGRRLTVSGAASGISAGKTVFHEEGRFELEAAGRLQGVWKNNVFGGSRRPRFPGNVLHFSVFVLVQKSES